MSPAPSSAASADSTTGSPEQASSTPSSASPIPTGEASCESGSPECPYTMMSALSLSENQRGELLLTEVAHQLTPGGGKPGQGYQAVLISSAAASPARTCPLPDDEPGSPATAPASSTSSHGSPGLFDPDGFSSRTFPVSSLAKAVGTSEACLERWPSSGMAWAGGFSTAVSSECRSDAGVCSSWEPSLTGILVPPQNVPAKYWLSARAARGILRRAEKRGRSLPSPLLAALEQVARTTTTGKEDGS